jgi:hypothetical protein
MLLHVRPASILDVGLGNGKLGFIARDFLDVMMGEKYRREEWKTKIDGIEVFENYIQEHQRAIYDDIFIGDAFDVIDTVGQYDMVILGDVLEHFKEDRAWQFLDKCASHCDRYMILNIPLGDKWIQPAIYGNPNEEHLSYWSFDQFSPFVEIYELHDMPELGKYACMLIRRDDYIVYRTAVKACEILSAEGMEKAFEYFDLMISGLGKDIKNEYVFVDSLVNSDRMQEAINRLKNIVRQYPDEAQVKIYLDNLKARRDTE